MANELRYSDKDDESDPPMAIATPVYYTEPEQVIFDEDLSEPAEHFLEMEPIHPTVVVAPFELEQIIMRQTGTKHVLRRRKFHGYFIAGIVLSFVGVSLLITVALYFAGLQPASSEPSLRELCSSVNFSPSSLMDWQPTQMYETGDLNLVAMNNNTIVGVKGQTMLETRTIGYDTEELPQVQYFEGIRSLIFAKNGILVISISNENVYMLSRKDGSGASTWQVLHEIAKPARQLDSNGREVVLWTGTDVHVFYDSHKHRQSDNEPYRAEQHIASIKSISALKISQDGTYIFVATSSEIRVFRRQTYSGRWEAQESIWIQAAKGSAQSQQDRRERKVKEDSNANVQLSTSADGKVVAILPNGRVGDLQIFTLRETWIRIGGDDGQHEGASSLVTVSESGERVALTTTIDTVVVLEKISDPDAVQIIAEIPVDGDVRALYFSTDNRLQVILPDGMTIYESQCASLMSESGYYEQHYDGS